MMKNKRTILYEFSADELAESLIQKLQSIINPNISSVKKKRLFTPDELSLEYSIPKATIYAWTSSRKIPFIKKGKRIYFLREDIEKWFTEGKRMPLTRPRKD